MSACSRAAGPPPEVQPRTELVEPPPAETVDELVFEAERYYLMGIEERQAGDTEAAEEHFDAAIRVFMEADVPPGEEEEFRQAFNTLVNRVQVATTEDLAIPIDADSTELTHQEIPPLSPAEVEMLRARLADTLPALPRFTIPMPADHPEVLAALEYLTTRRQEAVEGGLSRATRYMPMIREIFAQYGVPRELSWIPLIESLFKPTVRSRASAVGLWQLMAPTARLYGLQVNSMIDERRDPVKATHAIARFLLDYYQEFQDWHNAIAAYNGGKGRVGRALRRAGVDSVWALSETNYLPRETREFTPKILSAILIGTDPEAYGLTVIEQPPFAYDEVTIDTMTDLEVIAEAAGTTLETITELNPQLLRRTTPNVDDYVLRVPEGTSDAFRVAYAAIPPDERLRVVEHRVDRGETLGAIASEYGVSVSAIADFNNIRNRHRIGIGQEILIPVSQARAGATSRATADIVQGDTYDRGDQIVHTVRSGESLWTIARAYATSVAALKRWNNLGADRIDRGDRLALYYGTTTTPAAVADAGPTVSASTGPIGGEPPAIASYEVRRGDTLTAIARRHDVSVPELRRWNGLRSDRIHPGDRMVIRGGTGDALVETDYLIRRGDTLTTIARRFGVSVRQICDWNGISPRTTLYPGNRLTIRSSAGAGS